MSRLTVALQLLRPKHWLKNTFIWVGVIFANAWHDTALIAQVGLVTVAFCVTASLVYIINDLCDCKADQLNPYKQQRPLATGTASPTFALTIIALLLVCLLALNLWLSPAARIILLAYLVINLAYSFGLKKIAVLDVGLIACGFMLRILAGTLGVNIPPSPWLIVCGLLITLFLGFSKRYAEIILLKEQALQHRPVLQFYSPPLLKEVMIMLAMAMIICYGLYAYQQDHLFAGTEASGKLIYTVPLVVSGILRYLYLLFAPNGPKNADVVELVAQDRVLLATVLVWLGLTVFLIMLSHS